jgi:S1-C subfamily serine protease
MTHPTKTFPVPGTPYFTTNTVEEIVYHVIGSGVVVGYSGMVFVVTAEHVIPPDGNVYFRVPQKGGGEPAHYSHTNVVSQTGLDWVRSKDDDLALTFFGHGPEDRDEFAHVPSENLFATYDETSVGDDVFVLGYPSSVTYAFDPALHVVRNGIVAAKLGNGRILVDAFLFPGNSGGPVFWKPSTGLSIQNQPLLKGRSSSLVGIVSQTLSYSDVATSLQTKRPRVSFEENSGLAVVISASRIRALLGHTSVQDAVRRWQKSPQQN